MQYLAHNIKSFDSKTRIDNLIDIVFFYVSVCFCFYYFYLFHNFNISESVLLNTYYSRFEALLLILAPFFIVW